MIIRHRDHIGVAYTETHYRGILHGANMYVAIDGNPQVGNSYGDQSLPQPRDTDLITFAYKFSSRKLQR